MANMQISQKGVDLIKSFEGLRLKAYNATGEEKYLTIGYGHYGSDVKAGQTITEQEAEDLLRKDLQRYVDGVNNAIHVDVTQNQFDAMVSLCYNIGIGGFQKSTLCELINKGDFEGASKQFALWNKGGGKVLAGLVRRRAKETELFNEGGSVVSVAKPAPAPKAKGYLEKGDNGAEVKELQTLLEKAGFELGSIDGDFGDKTDKATRSFQQAYGLKVDGLVGNATMTKLKSVVAEKEAKAKADAEAKAKAKESTGTHTVVGGDTLSELAVKYHTSIQALKALNGLTSDVIKVGQVLKVTGSAPVHAEPSQETHKVVAGDTLSEIADHYSTSVSAIKSLNGLKSDVIKIGQVLKIPAHGSASRPKDIVYGTLTVVTASLWVHEKADFNSRNVKAIQKGEAYKVYGIKNGLYHLGGNQYCSSNPKYVRFVKNPHFGK